MTNLVYAVLVVLSHGTADEPLHTQTSQWTAESRVEAIKECHDTGEALLKRGDVDGRKPIYYHCLWAQVTSE